MDLKRVPVPVVTVLGILIIVAGVWVFDPFTLRQPTTLQPVEQPVITATPGQSPSSEEADAAAAAAALVALTDDPLGGVATAAKEGFDASVALPPGSKLTPEPDSWGPDGIGGGTMDVVLSVAGEPETRYVAIMIKENSQWKVLGTVEQSEGAVTP